MYPNDKSFRMNLAITLTVLMTLISSSYSTKTSCSSGFDVYFILDKSTSVSESNFQSDTVQFVQDILQHLTSPKLRTSIITFSNNANLILPLTSNRAKILTAINKLKKVVTGGNTHLEHGIDKVISQVTKEGKYTASVVIILTDGELTNEQRTFPKANRLRELGATAIAVGVGNYIRSQLNKLANKPSTDYVFTATNYQTLQFITEKIINKACIEVLRVEPNKVCVGVDYGVTLRGHGFTRTFGQSKIICKFIINETHSFVTNASEITDTQSKCNGPVINTIGRYVTLQVSVNGKTFISTENRVTGISCKKSNHIGSIVAVLFALLLVAIMVIWWFWRLFPCAKEKRKKEAGLLPDVVEPESSTKKWPTVDASLYGGGGVGGVKPVRVNWGGKGATEAGNKLTAAPNAKTMSMGDDDVFSSTSASHSSKPSCFKRVKNSLLSFSTTCYAKIASVRPIKGGKNNLYSTSSER